MGHLESGIKFGRIEERKRETDCLEKWMWRAKEKKLERKACKNQEWKVLFLQKESLEWVDSFRKKKSLIRKELQKCS